MPRTDTLEPASTQRASRAATTMKAAVIREFGGIDVLQYDDVSIPQPKPGVRARLRS